MMLMLSTLTRNDPDSLISFFHLTMEREAGLWMVVHHCHILPEVVIGISAATHHTHRFLAELLVVPAIFFPCLLGSSIFGGTMCFRISIIIDFKVASSACWIVDRRNNEMHSNYI